MSINPAVPDLSRLGVALLCAVLFGACRSEDGPRTSRSQVGDTLFVHSAAPSRDTARMREVLRVGQLQGADEYLFRDISMFAIGPSGEIYIAELEGDLRVFDRTGKFLRTVAGEGRGPGEVRYVVGMDVADDGRLAILDFGNQRVSIYSPEGEFLHQIRRPAGRPRYGRDAIRFDSEGELWIGVHPPRRGPAAQPSQRRPVFGRLTGDAVVKDTVFLPDRAWTGCRTRDASYAGGFFEDSRLPFHPFVHWAMGEGGSLVVGCAAAYSFDILRPDGVVARVSRAWTPPQMTDAEHDWYTEWQGPVPRERPAFLRLWLDSQQRVWAWPGATGWEREVRAELQERGAPPTAWTWSSSTDGFDVFGPDGTWTGHVATPETWAARPYPGNRDPQFVGDTIWGVTRDEFDAVYVSKFVIEWPE